MATKPTDDTVLRGEPVGRTPLKLGRYTLKHRLGVGGMAEVYLAEQDGPASFKKTVVVKRILPSLAQDQAFVDMFVREAQVAARLHHTNIVQIFELGEEQSSDGTREYFIAMEYIDGLTLQRLAAASWGAGSAVPTDVAIRAIVDAARGLHAAHTLSDEQGRPLLLVHRDISPDNLMVARDGVTRVLDFGIAKGGGAGPKTRTGNLRGKIPFMAPEQIEGVMLDGRCDLFALGVSLYWLLCGERPFDRGTDFHTMHAILKEQPRPPTQLNPGIPPALERVILKLLEKDRANRFATAAQLADELEELASPGTGAGRKSMLRFIERYAPASQATGNPLSESGDKTSNTRPLVASRSGDAIDVSLTSAPAVAPRAITMPDDAAQASLAPLPTAPLPTAPLPTASLPTTPLPTTPLPTAPLPTASPPTTPLPTAPQDKHPVIDLLAPPPRQGNALGLLAAAGGVIVLFGAIAVIAFWLLQPADAGQPTDAGAAVAAIVDAGMPAATIVDAGAPVTTIVDGGALVTTITDAGAPVTTITDAGAPVAAILDAGATAPPPPRRVKIATIAPRGIELRTEAGALLGKGGDTLSVVAGTRRVIAIDKMRGVSTPMNLAGETLDYGALPTGTVVVKQIKGVYAWLGHERLTGTAPISVVVGTYQLRLTGREQPVTRPLTVKAGEQVVIDVAQE